MYNFWNSILYISHKEITMHLYMIYLSDGCYYHDTTVCSRIFGLNFTKFPNVFGHQNYNEAANVWYYWSQIPSDPCQMLYTHLMCAALFPVCRRDTTQQICRQSCHGKSQNLIIKLYNQISCLLI